MKVGHKLFITAILLILGSTLIIISASDDNGVSNVVADPSGYSQTPDLQYQYTVVSTEETIEKNNVEWTKYTDTYSVKSASSDQTYSYTIVAEIDPSPTNGRTGWTNYSTLKVTYDSSYPSSYPIILNDNENNKATESIGKTSPGRIPTPQGVDFSYLSNQRNINFGNRTMYCVGNDWPLTAIPANITEIIYSCANVNLTLIGLKAKIYTSSETVLTITATTNDVLEIHGSQLKQFNLGKTGASNKEVKLSKTCEYASLKLSKDLLSLLIKWHMDKYNGKDLECWDLLNNVSIMGAEQDNFVNVDGYIYYVGDRTSSFTIGDESGDIKIPEGAVGIYQSAFNGCTGLTSVKLPSTVKSIGKNAFAGCTSLVTIDASACSELSIDSNGMKDSMTYGDVNLKNLKLPFMETIPTFLVTSDSKLQDFEIKYDSNNTKSMSFNLEPSVISGFAGTLNTLKLPIDQVDSTTMGKVISLISLLGSSTDLVLYHNGSTDKVTQSFTVASGNDTYAVLFGVSEDLTIPSGTTKIIANQMSGNTILKSLTIPDSVKAIEQGAFQSCAALTSITLGSGLTSIGDRAFNGCALTSIDFGNSSALASIGSYAFASCISLTNLDFPSSLTSIGDYAFHSDTKITAITFNSSQLSIGKYAFDAGSGRFDLQSIKFNNPSNVTIDDYSFYSPMSTISKIELPEGITKLGTNSFGAVKEISLPKSLASIVDTSSKLRSFTLASDGKVTVADGCPMFKLDGGILYSCNQGTPIKIFWASKDVTTLTIPDSVTSIMDGGLFRFNEGLTEVKIGSGLTTMNPMEFLRCYALDTVIFSDSSSLKEIPARAFSGTALKSIALPDSVTTVGVSAFYDCAALTTVSTTTSSSLKTIGAAAFYGCQSLNSVTLPAGLTTLGDVSGVDPDTGKTISGNVFWSDTKLSSITFSGDGDLSCSNGLVIKKSGSSDGTSYGILYVMPAVSTIEIPADTSGYRVGAFEDSNLSSISVATDNTSFYTNSEHTVLVDKSTKSIIYIPSLAKTVNIKATDDIVSFSDSNVWSDGKGNNTGRYITEKAYSLLSMVWESNGDVNASGFYGSISSVAFNVNGKLTLGPSTANLKILEINANSLVCDNNLLATGSCTVTINLKGSDSDNIVGSGGTVKQVFNSAIKELNINNLHGDLTRYFSDDWKYDASLIIYRDGLMIDTLSTLLGVSIETTSQDYTPKVVKIYKASTTGSSYVLVDMLNEMGYANKNLDITMSGSDSVGSMIDEYICLIPSTIGDSHKMVFTISLKNDVEKKSVTMDFRVSGVSNRTYQVILGNSLTSAQLSVSDVSNTGYTFDGWYVDNKLSRPYAGSAISDDMTLYARWSLNDGLTVTIVGDDYIESIYKTDGIVFYSGDKVVSGTKLQFTPISNEFEVLGWTVNGSEKTGRILEVEVTSETTVVPNMRYSSASNILSTISTIDAPYEDIVEVWSKSFEVNTSMQTWTGFPSTPLVVDNTIFVRAADTLYKIDSSDGSVLKSKKVDNTTAVAFYHYLGYGGGYIIDYMTQKAYDLDFENEKSLPLNFSAVFYDDGCYYGLNSSGKLYKMDSQFQLVTTGGWNGGIEVSWHAIYGSTSAPLFINGYIYFIEITGTDREQRSISAIDVSSGTKTTQRLSELDNKLIDDGWLSSYEYEGSTYLFLTAYSSGLFEGDSGNGSKVGCVKLKSDGTFDKFDDSTEAIFMNLKNGSLASGLIVVDGRGYINVTGTKETGAAVLYVVDVNEFIKTKGNKEIPIGDDPEKTTKTNAYVIYATESFANHGNIVVNTSQYRTGGSVYIYELAYDSGKQALYVFEDHAGKTEATSYYKTKTIGSNYCSQAVRLDVNGGFVWYTDSGTLYYAASIDNKMYTFFVDYGDTAVSYQSSGENAYDALVRAFDREGVQFTYSAFDNIGVKSINKLSNSTEGYWNIYEYDGSKWNVMDLTTINSTNNVVLICYGGGNVQGENLVTDKNWVYLDDGGVSNAYTFSNSIDNIVVGKTMSLLEIKDSSTKVSGNSVSSTIAINSIDADQKVKVYAMFADNSFMQIASKVRVIDGAATVEVSMSGNATPSMLLVSLTSLEGNQLMEYRIDLGTAR